MAKKSDVSIKYAPRKKNEARGRRKVKGNEWMDGGDGGERGFNKARPPLRELNGGGRWMDE